eukprot:TRINITY_DN8003_c0_g1_i1.p1 TRINITY_DN8003_c0_g1~~TRINITY_DN8003_c0_g1_i1.p1  ORF type:complete len:148 (+),score=32.08 TRINITY_DN8003_c0_g1_i1:215-658(+)
MDHSLPCRACASDAMTLRCRRRAALGAPAVCNAPGRPARCLLFCFFLGACLFGEVDAKPKKYNYNQPKLHWKKENECAKTACKHIHTDENDDCLAKCVSEKCHAEIYASDPLEPGEINKEKGTMFNKCVKEEGEEEAKRKAEERKSR